MGKHSPQALDSGYLRHAPARRLHPLVRRVLTVIGIVVALSTAAGVGTAIWLNSSLSNIKHVDLRVPESQRPQTSQSDGENILMLGADAGTQRNGPGTSVIKDAARQVWPQGKYRSDATMLVHIDADRHRGYVVSIPRDSYLPIHDQTGEQRNRSKINAALSLYGPSGALATVESFTGQRIDHVAIVDWDGFEAITNALGGVMLKIPGHGRRKLDGAEALEYVRERHHLPHGDFDRVKRQQNFLRAIMTKLIDRGSLRNPVKLKKTLDSITRNLAVDDGWSNGSIRSLTFSMRNIHPSDITFLTIPTKGTESDPEAGSIVRVDEPACQTLFKAMASDNMATWVNHHNETVLGGSARVN